MNLALLLADAFTATVWKQNVDVNLYRPDLMHNHRQMLSTPYLVEY